MSQKSTAVKGAAGFARAAQKAYTKKWSFLVVFLVVFFITLVVLASLDLLPDPPSEKKTSEETPVALADTTSVPAAPEPANRIEIPAIKLSVSVSDPETTNVEELDQALLTGAVRYPTSAKLGADGNVIIFGHSSYLPVVHNQAYKAFDGIQNLKPGDQIMVSGSDTVYVYAVDTVEKKNADEDGIALDVSGKKLTLATCDSFGTKSDRFVVSATFVESYPITQ